MIVRKVIAQLQFNKYFWQETQFYLKPYKDIYVRLILVNRSSFYVNSLEQFKTPKQTFPIDNRFTAVAVALEFQSSTREQCLRLFVKMQVEQYCFRNISHSILIEQSQI